MTAPPAEASAGATAQELKGHRRLLTAVAVAMLAMACAVVEQPPQAPAFDEEAVDAGVEHWSVGGVDLPAGTIAALPLGDNAPFTGRSAPMS